MAMNKQRKSSNLLNILNYDDAGNIVLRDYSQTIRYNWNGTIHAFTGPLSISSIAAAVTDTDRFLVSDGGVLKYRTGAEVLSDIGAIGGSGASGQVAYWNGTSSQTGSNNLFWDAANSRLGIGTNAPAYRLDANGNARINGTLNINNGNGLLINHILNATTNGDQQTGLGINVSFSDASFTGVNHYALQIAGSGYSQLTANVGQFNLPTNGFGLQVGWNKSNGGGETSLWYNKSAGSTGGLYIGENVSGTGTYYSRWFSGTGNLLLQNGGTFTDGGQRLQVQGDAFIKGSGATSATIGLQVQNSSGTNLLRVQNNGIVSIGDGPADTLSNNGDVILKLNSSFQYWTIQNRQNAGLEFLNQNYAGGYSFFTLTDARNTSQNQTNALFQRFFTQNSVNNRTFINVELRGDINQTGGANGISRGLYVNHTITAAADWRSIEWSNNSGWGLYGVGTAPNYLGGDLLVNSTSANNAMIFVSTNGKSNVIGIRVGGSTTQGTSIGFYANQVLNSTNSTEYIAFNSSQDIASGTYTIPNITGYFAQSATKPGTVTINNMFGFNAGSTLIQGTNNFGFYGNIPNGTNRWNLFMNGTADNYLAGKLVIGTTSVGTHALDVVGTTQISGNTFVSAGNLSIFTTNTPRRINVNVPNGSVAAAIGIESSGTIHSAIGIDTATTTFLQIASTQGIAFYSGSTIGNIVTQPTNERMRLTAAGRLLLGTTTESTFLLDVNGTARVSGDTYLATSSGSVGINTTSPGSKLEVYGGNASLRLVTYLGTARYGFGNPARNDDAAYIEYSGAGNFTGSLIFATNGVTSNVAATEKMRLEGNGNLLVGTTGDQGYRVQITSASADSHLNVWGATAPSIRLDNAASGATQRFVIGLATATNNFIQGANAGDVCMTPGTSSALVFGMWQTSSSSEVMRISTSSNVLIGKNTDSGQKLQVVGKVNLTSLPTSATGLMAGDVWNNGGVLNIV